jgi:acyl-CoA thioesterase FadM
MAMTGRSRLGRSDQQMTERDGMNLWLRLIWCLVAALFGRRLDPSTDLSLLHFRVWPQDLDPSLHMNNGRYLTLMDLGRLDVLARSGLLAAARRHRWTPIASGIQIRFRRELRLWQKYRLETRLVSWQSQLVVMEQRFVFEGGPFAGQTAAHALFKGGLYDRSARRFVDLQRMMSEIGVLAQSPALTADVTAFLASDDTMRQVQKSASAESDGAMQQHTTPSP